LPPTVRELDRGVLLPDLVLELSVKIKGLASSFAADDQP
jgi:hypothetical protein